MSGPEPLTAAEHLMLAWICRGNATEAHMMGYSERSETLHTRASEHEAKATRLKALAHPDGLAAALELDALV